LIAFYRPIVPKKKSPRSFDYGFNGKENDKDFGNFQIVQDYGFRIYNPSIARFLSVDPLASSYPWYTPYQFAGNTPIQAIDLDGLEEKRVIQSVTATKSMIKVTNLDEFRSRDSYKLPATGEDIDMLNRYFYYYDDTKYDGWENTGDYQYLHRIVSRGGRTFYDDLTKLNLEEKNTRMLHNRVVMSHDEEQRHLGLDVYGSFYIDESNHKMGVEVRKLFTIDNDGIPRDNEGNEMHIDDDAFNALLWIATWGGADLNPDMGFDAGDGNIIENKSRQGFLRELFGVQEYKVVPGDSGTYRDYDEEGNYRTFIGPKLKPGGGISPLGSRPANSKDDSIKYNIKKE